MQITYQEVFETVGRVQSQTREFEDLSPDHQKLAASIATIAAKSVIELLERNSNRIVMNDDSSPFPLVFAEWAQQYNPKTHFERFLTIMLWLKEQENVTEVTTSEIAYMYEKARWKKPANLADVFAKGAEKLFFAEADTDHEEGLKQWRMTRTGYQYINNKHMEA